MCGIAGLFRIQGGITPHDVEAVERATTAQSHRGPDDSGFFRDERVVLGFRRLAIIDLSPAGHQPMSNEDGSVWVIFNGEIYNYRELRPELLARGHSFRSHTDTEILLHGYEEWGIEGLLQRLRGMYAFALYDSRQSCCILARDRFGIKPLYYYQPPRQDLVAFASEVKALVRSGIAPAERDPEGIMGFLLFGSVPAPYTSTRNIRSLMPGHYLRAAGDGVSIRKYWDLESSSDRFSSERESTREETEAALAELLADSVNRHLISDVPLGIFLSGGVDSAGLVALASRSGQRLTTLTVVFDEKEFSEAAPARRVAEHFATDHREVRVTRDDFMRELPHVLSAMDQPTNDGVNTFFVSRAARQAGLTVVLSGLGGDEVFWGYKYYRWLNRFGGAIRGFSSLPAAVQGLLLRAVAGYGRHFGGDRWARVPVLQGRISDASLYVTFRGFFPPEQVGRLLGLTSREVSDAIERHLADGRREGSGRVADANTFNYFELKKYMHDQLLRDTDVFSMASSIEARVPYLDHLVVERAARALSTTKLVEGTNKPLLVNAIGEPLVRAAAAGRKLGFTFPFAQWMRETADQLEGIALQSGLLEKAGVHHCWKNFREGHQHWSRAWALAVLGAEV